MLSMLILCIFLPKYLYFVEGPAIITKSKEFFQAKFFIFSVLLGYDCSGLVPFFCR